ncbi:hypothetical protein HOLleu_07935 [Holothuria leucospilota]|uniref:Peptidase aspartic putative domain-containing protein n=1 Tax=Holothuria leucospilota TaxID=206669 RepID=A0A9Q1CGQ9_HOLLE|nr:hypothetical protein HOLleu_07935 [Holothuria leucospilota]
MAGDEQTPSQDEKLKDLKKQRGIVKTKLTRTLKQIKTEIESEEKDELIIEDLMKKACTVTEELEKINGDVLFLCEGAEYQQAEDYIQECFKEFIDTKKLVNSSLKDQKETPAPNIVSTDTKQDNQSQLRLSSLNLLTAANTIKFSGNPLYYHSFVSGYNSAVEGIGDFSIKLKALLALCEGDALASIQYALLQNPEDGLKAALETLKIRFGNPPVIAQAWVRKIVSSDKLHSGNINRFSDDLENCVAALTSLKCLGELDNQTNIRIISEKLPRFLQQRWTRESTKIKRSTGKYGSLKELVTFVRISAEEMTDPILGGGSGEPAKSEVGSVRIRKDNKGKTFYAGGKNGAASAKDSNCCGCGSTSHPIWRCSVFKELSVNNRWDVVTKNKLCFKCLGNHFARNCKREMRCDVGGCRSDHNRLLHRSKENDSEQGQIREGEQGSSQPSEPRESEGQSRGRNFLNKGQGLALRIVPVMVRQGTKEIKINALLDDGSEQTYIDSGLAAELGLSGTQGEVCVGLLNGLEKRFASSEIELEISNVIDSRKKYKIRGMTIDQVCGDLKPKQWPRISKDWDHLKDINFPVPADGPVALLIGVDHVDLHRALEERAGGVGEPVARKTPLGWTCVGPTTKGHRFLTYHTKQVKTFKCQIVESVDDTIKKFWEIDSMGIKEENVPQTNEERRALELVKESLKTVDGRYEVKIPWSGNKDEISNNKIIAERRLHNLEKKLTSDKCLGEEYCKVINDYEEKGYIKKVNESDKGLERAWYLPHFAVVKPDRETTKVRIVYDASAKYNGLSLNDVILNGPKLQTDLFDVLLNFRRNKIALMCDISEMYMQVGIDKDDRGMLRFLWRDLDQNRAPDIYEFQRLAFGLNAAPFISQLVAKENAKKYQNEFSLASKTVLQSTYMDDSMDSVSDVNIGIELYHQINELWSRAGMEARKWLSNSKEVLHEIPPNHRAQQVRLAEGELPSVKALGLTWVSEEDMFIFSRLVAPEENKIWTKRKVLSKLASVFDPLGFVSPVTVRGKILMQEIWKSGSDWDEPVNPRIAQKFQKWCDDLDCMANIKVDRCLCPYSDQKMEIHTFVDASSEAYGAITYVKSMNNDEASSTIRLVAAKTRVAPLKSTSIPRLELMAAVLGLRLTESVVKTLGFNMRDVTFWSDSSNVLWWIRGRSRNFKPFVANRVGVIQTKSNPSQWRYVPTKLNPADVASRGTTARELCESRLWWNGPEFLKKSRDYWPENKFEEVLRDTEQKKVSSFLTKICLESADFRLNPERFSNWQRLVHVFAYVSRFVTNCRNLQEHRQKGELTVEEVRDAEIAFIRSAQE